MQNQPNKVAVFSGRYDPPHLGHLITILSIAALFGRVIVVILDYEEREACTSGEAQKIFNSVFDMIFPGGLRSKVEVVIHDKHFGKITFAEYDLFLRNIGVCYNHCTYLSGNPEVLANMERQQIKHSAFPRSYDKFYTGTVIRERLRFIDKGDVSVLEE
jgi:cytidyltransferase-like protein